MHLAQFNIARIKYPLDDPRMKEFVDNIDLVHRVADRVGLIYRLKGDGEKDATGVVVFNDPTIVPNLTVWKNAEALKSFAFKTLHKKFFDKKDEWFAPLDMPRNVMWHCEEDYIPKMSDGEDRMRYFITHGPTDYAFDWSYLK